MLAAKPAAGQTMANASKPQFLGAVCSAVKKFRNAAPQIVRAAVEARPAWRNDIIRTAVRCLGQRVIAPLLSRIHNALVGAYPG